MMTKILSVESQLVKYEKNHDILYSHVDKLSLSCVESLKPAVELLKGDNTVAMPTETVYGLAANALSDTAVKQIFKVKGRPSDNPLIIHISSLNMLAQIMDDEIEFDMNKKYTEQEIMRFLPEQYHVVVREYWPGPLTILLPAPLKIPSSVTAGQKTVAVRFPAHPVARALIDLCGFPLAAPSANRSGRPSPTSASHVFADLNGLIPMVIDGGSCDSGVESTVLDSLRNPPAILRPGGVVYEDLIKIPGYEQIQVHSRDFSDEKLEQAPTTPGMKYRHYTPEADVTLIEESRDLDTLVDRIKQVLGTQNHMQIGVMGTSHVIDVLLKLVPNVQVYKIGEKADPEIFAKELFAGLRELEQKNVKMIFVEGIGEEREGLAVMNRLRKAASRII